MVELARSGRTPEELSREFGPTAQSIRNWLTQADRDEGRRADGLTTAERQELVRLRRENRQLKMERDTLSKPRLGSLGRRTKSQGRMEVREREPSQLPHHRDVPHLGCLPQRLSRMGQAFAIVARRSITSKQSSSEPPSETLASSKADWRPAAEQRPPAAPHSNLAGNENGRVASTRNMTSWSRSVLPALKTSIGISAPCPFMDWPASA